MKTKEKIIGLRELRENTDTYITKVGRGESFLVIRRSKPIFRLSHPEADEESGWETVVDFTKIRPGGVPVDEVLKELRKLNG